MTSSPFTIRSKDCSRQKLYTELSRVLSSTTALSLPIVLQGGSGLDKQQLISAVAADLGLRTTCVSCKPDSTPRDIMSLIVAHLEGEGKHKAKRVELVEYSRALTGYCPLEKAKPWCIIIDNVECISEHQDMAGLVRVGEWSGYKINAHFVLVSNLCWTPSRYARSVPHMAVFQFEQLSLPEVQKILIDDPNLDISDEARDIWAARVKKYLPCCAIWCRDLKGLRQELQEVQYQYASLQMEDPSLSESQLGHRLHESWQTSSGCKPTVHDSEFFIKLRQQATKEGVIQRGLECILLLISMYAAAWNHNSVDRPFLYGSRDGIKRKRDAQYVTQLRKEQWVSDRISKGPKGVPRSRLFEYLLYLCKRTDHRLDELDQHAANQLAPRERLEHDAHIEQHLQWCVQHRLIAEEVKEGKKIYHLWLREGLAVALFEELQKQGRLLHDDKLEHYVLYN